MTKLYVGNLSYGATEETIRSLFESHGTVEGVDLIVDRDTGRSKGFGFVEMINDAQGRAIAGVNGKEIDGRALTVNEARCTRVVRNRYSLAAASIAAALLATLGWGAWPVAPRLPEAPPAAQPSPALKRWTTQSFHKLPLYFIENRGQVDAQVAYYVPGRDASVYFTGSGVTFALTAPNDTHQPFVQPVSSRALGLEQPRLPAVPEVRQWAVKLDFIGANPVWPEGQDATGAVFSYFKGHQEDWKTGLKGYSRVVYRELWPGIDLVYQGKEERLKYEFVVRPGARPEQIRLAYRGATEVGVNGAGQLEVSTPVGGFRDDRPYAYQEAGQAQRKVAAGYALRGGGGYGFEVGEYDRSRPLVLDPAVFIYSGYIGGAGQDFGSAIAVDAAGSAYITGVTNSPQDTFPLTVGPSLSYKGTAEAFVAKVKADGTGLVYAGYIGGAAYDQGQAIAVDAAGNAYVAGYTSSSEATFPVTVGPSLTFTGGTNAFVAKVNAAGTSLVYAGYIGGALQVQANGIALDAGGNAYVTGQTNDVIPAFPAMPGSSLIYQGASAAFVAKVSADGKGLVYGVYIGGFPGKTNGQGIAVDAAGSAYVTGATDSDETSFPVKVGPSLKYSGNTDVFVAKLSADGKSLVYAGYIGGVGQDLGNGIAVDAAGNAYVTGFTSSKEATFPVKVGPNLKYGGGADAFVAKVSADGKSLVYAGYIGGASDDFGNGIAVDAAGNAYVTGYTHSSEATFPVKVGPSLKYQGGGNDAFVAKVSAGGESLVYAGYIGGSNLDYGYGIAVDAAGNAYVTGNTYSSEATFPVKAGPGLTFRGLPAVFGFNAFVAKIGAGNPVISQVVDGGGWKTSFILVNLQATPADFTLRFWKDDGTPLRLAFQGSGNATEILTGAIPAGGSRTIESLGAGNTLAQGWAELVTNVSVIGGLAVFRHQVPGTPDQEAAVNLVPSTGRFVLPFDNSQGAVTGVALVNTNASQPAVSTATFRGEDGGAISSVPANLSPRSHTAFAMPDLFPSLANRRGVAEFFSAAPDFGALGLRFNPGGAFTSFPELSFEEASAATGSRTVAQVADGAGWKSTFILANMDTAPAPFTLRFWKDDGNPLRLLFDGVIGGASDVFTATIPVGGSLTLASQGVDQALSQGWAELATTRAVGGFAVFRHRVAGQTDQEAAVGLTASVKRFVLPFDNTQGFVTALALLNANATQPLLVTVVIRDEAGVPLAPDVLAVLPRGHLAFAVQDRFPITANRRGVVEFSAPSADLSGLGLRFNPSGAFTSFPTFAK